VAAVLQVALDVALDGTTCVYDGGKLVITSPNAVTGTVSLGAAATYAGAADNSASLKLTAVTGAAVVAPLATETVAQSLALCRNKDPKFYGVMVTEHAASFNDAGSVVILAAAAWAQAADLFFTYTTQETDCKNPSGSKSAPSNLLLSMQGLGYRKVAGMYSGQSAYADAGIQGLLATVDYSARNSIRTIMFKSLPGVAIDNLETSEMLAIVGSPDGSSTGQCGNAYVAFGDSDMILRGMTASGRWIDEIVALDWLKDSLMVNVFNKMKTSPTRIPGTNGGVAKLIDSTSPTWGLALSNGLISSGGVWKGDPLGEIKTNDVLPAGWYMYADSVATQSADDRAARKSPPISAIAVGAGALQYCAIQVVFQQ
jgi:hypothetical protein